MPVLRFLVRCLPAIAFFGLLAAAAAIGFHFGTKHQPTHEHVGVDLYTCSMHPQVRQTGPGVCPICRMELGKLQSTSEDGKVTIDPVVVQNMGVRIEHARTEVMPRTVRAVGVLAEDQTRLRDVTLKFGGYLETLEADTVGMPLRAGQPLFRIYSPELVVAQEELIAARKSGNVDLLEAARRRLELWDLEPALIDRLAGLERAERTIDWPCPIDGVLLARDVVAGAAVAANQRILRVVDLRTLWLDAQLSESSFGDVALGRSARVELTAIPGHSLEGEVVFIAPAIDPITRTLLVRIQVENGDGKLVPGMFARVSLDAGSPDAVVTIDHDAVISTGRRDVVWVARGGGRFEPRIVALGARGDGGRVAVRSGIADGDAVVVSGHFLIDSESRLRGGMRMLDDAGLIADGDQVPPPPALELDAPTQARIDAILSSYLQVTTAFAADRDDGEGWTALRAAAEALASESPELLRERAQALLEATSTDAGDLATRREVLPKISAAAIAIFRAARPSSSFGAQLHVFHCPMAPIDWVQLGPQLRNPFYGSEMLECGEATGLLPLGAEGAAAMKPAVLELDAATQARVDAILRSYLQVTSAFAADQDDALGWVAMQEAARALASESPAVLRQHAQALADAIAVEANDLASRRAALPKISAAAIELFRNARPSASFGAQLHVFHCPMAPIDWVQLGPQLRNPFYGSEMLECGDAVGTLPLRAEDGK